MGLGARSVIYAMMRIGREHSEKGRSGNRAPESEDGGKRVLHSLTGHGEYVRIINWSSDSKIIVSGALDNVIRVFDVETGISLCGARIT